MHGIKRDASNFPKFKDEKQWNEWYNKTKEQAKSQFIDEIFNINYTPGSIDYITLFDLKKRFMYAAFTNNLLTDKEKPLVRQHEGDYNAHAIHRELLAHMSISTKASVVSSTILTYTTTAKFGNGTWNE